MNRHRNATTLLQQRCRDFEMPPEKERHNKNRPSVSELTERNQARMEILAPIGFVVLMLAIMYLVSFIGFTIHFGHMPWGLG